MFESLLLASVLLITVSQFLPKEESEKTTQNRTQRPDKKPVITCHPHKKKQPCRENFDRAEINRTTAGLLYHLK